MNLKHLPGHLARRFHQISSTLFDLEMSRAGLGLTSVQFAALVAVRDNPSIDQATLAGMIAYDGRTVYRPGRSAVQTASAYSGRRGRIGARRTACLEIAGRARI
jgi:hypothetical protein